MANHSDNHPQENLAIGLERKVENCKNTPIIFWPPGKTHVSKYGDFQNFFPQNLAMSSKYGKLSGFLP
jgi:hypothetical protein